ncbi:MAG: helix-turn-helix domain-containing protein [Chloroflexota bacterium]
MTVDNLPEFTRYRDEGCEAAPSCLACPFSRCLEEAPRARQKAATAARARDIAALYRQGMSTAEIARTCSRSIRTVQRLLKLDRDAEAVCHSEEASATEESGGGTSAPSPGSSHTFGMT